MTIQVPLGLGIGTNVETFDGRERAMWHQAVSRLGARWSYSWSRLDVGPGYVPSIHPEYKGVCSANDLLAWKRRMTAGGLQWDQLTWTFCNEPENSGKTPREIAGAVVRQLGEFDKADIRLRIIYPNNNINTERSFDFGVELFQRTRQAGVFLSPSCHLWCEPQYVPAVWSRYRNWVAGYGERLGPITITECGPGPMAPMSQWLEFMPLAYALLDDPLVGGLAPFSAYPKTRDGVERYPGFMLPDGTLTALGVQYVAERRRRYVA